MTSKEKAKKYSESKIDAATRLMLRNTAEYNCYKLGRYDGYLAGAKENGFILHDLEKDSNDLPKENKQYLCKLKWFVGGGISYECLYWNNDFDYWTDKCGESICDKVICWYELPQGE